MPASGIELYWVLIKVVWVWILIHTGSRKLWIFETKLYPPFGPTPGILGILEVEGQLPPVMIENLLLTAE